MKTLQSYDAIQYYCWTQWLLKTTKSADDSSSKYKIKLKTKCYHQPKTRSYDDEVDGLSGIDVGNPAITFNPV